MWPLSTPNAANMGTELNISVQQMCGFCRGQHQSLENLKYTGTNHHLLHRNNWYCIWHFSPFTVGEGPLVAPKVDTLQF